HPFLREFFEKLIELCDPRQIHEALRSRLAPSLDERPSSFPTDHADLDRYERLIDFTRRAGKTEKAFDLYFYGMGGFKHLAQVLGEYSRGLRILSSFSQDGTPATAGYDLPGRQREVLINAWGLYAKDLGDLNTSKQAFMLFQELQKNANDGTYLAIGWQ